MFGEWSEVNLTDLLLFGGLTCSFDVCFWTFSKLLQGNMAFVDVLNKLRVKEFLAESAALSRDALAESSRRHVVERACACQVTTRYLCLGVVWKGTEWALSWPTLCFVFWGFVETLDPSLQYLIQGSLAQAQVSIWCDTFTFWGFTCWTLPGVLRFTRPRITEWNLSVGCFTRFTFYRNAFAWNFDGMHSISGEFIPHRFKFVYVAITNQPWTLFFYLLTCGTPPPPPPFHAFSPPSQGISQRILIFLPLVQGTTWRPSSSILLSEPFFLSVLLQSGDKMAVVSLFTFSSLTDGRTVRDLPKQHREKKTERFLVVWLLLTLKLSWKARTFGSSVGVAEPSPRHLEGWQWTSTSSSVVCCKRRREMNSAWVRSWFLPMWSARPLNSFNNNTRSLVWGRRLRQGLQQSHQRLQHLDLWLMHQRGDCRMILTGRMQKLWWIARMSSVPLQSSGFWPTLVMQGWPHPMRAMAVVGVPKPRWTHLGFQPCPMMTLIWSTSCLLRWIPRQNGPPST